MGLRFAVLGGGMSGLSAALELRRAHPEATLRLYEASERVGGAVHTERTQGFVIERGPDAWLTEPAHVIRLVEQLGLSEQLVRTCPEARGAWVVRDKQLHPVPDGFALVAPGQWLPLLGSPLLSWRGKLRALCEPALAPFQRRTDTSLASFVSDRLGSELLDYLAEPLAGGIYGADPRLLSIEAALPRYAALGAGSVTRGLRKQRSARTAGARYGLFASLARGCGALPEAIAAELGPDCLRLGERVQGLRRRGKRWRVESVPAADPSAKARQSDYDAVVLALPARHLAPVLRELDAPLSVDLAAIPYGSSAVLTFAFRREQIVRPLDAYGLVVPRVEGLSTRAVSFSSVKWPGRAPVGYVLLRAFVGGAGAEGDAALDEATLFARIAAELSLLLGIRGQAQLRRLDRYVEAMPRYHLGHECLVARIDEGVARHRGLALAGNAYRGVGLPEAVRSGTAAAHSLIATRPAT